MRSREQSRGLAARGCEIRDDGIDAVEAGAGHHAGVELPHGGVRNPLFAGSELRAGQRSRKRELGGDSASAEREIFGVTHAEVGAYLLGLWGIPFPIVEAVAFHHRPHEVAPESRALVAAIHIASGLVEEMTDSHDMQRPASTSIDSSALIDASFIREAGLEEALQKSRTAAEALIAKSA